MNIDLDSFDELIEDVQINMKDDKISCIEIKYPSYRLELFQCMNDWIVLPKTQLLERLYIDTTNTIEITNIKSANSRIIGIQFETMIVMIKKTNKKNEPIKNYLHKIILENGFESYFVIRSIWTINKYDSKPLGVNLVNLKEKEEEENYLKSLVEYDLRDNYSFRGWGINIYNCAGPVFILPPILFLFILLWISLIFASHNFIVFF